MIITEPARFCFYVGHKESINDVFYDKSNTNSLLSGLNNGTALGYAIIANYSASSTRIRREILFTFMIFFSPLSSSTDSQHPLNTCRPQMCHISIAFSATASECGTPSALSLTSINSVR